MFFSEEKRVKNEIITTGKLLYNLGMVAGTGGNLSARTGENKILITATGTSLGSLNSAEIIEVDLDNQEQLKGKQLTSEFPLHRLIYKNLANKAVIHCHPALSNGYFAVCSDLKALTFETKLYLGNIPVIEQETPAVTNPQAVVEALKNNSLVFLKNHGVVSIGADFREALHLIEVLEEAVRTAAVARLFKKEALDPLESALKKDLESRQAYAMFSHGHIQAIVDLVNQDDFIQKKGEEMGLTLRLAIKLDGSDDKVYRFTFEKGRITELAFTDDAPYIISAPASVWEAVFLGKLEPFVATTQGKMKLKGELGKLARWYVPFSRLFELFKQVKIK